MIRAPGRLTRRAFTQTVAAGLALAQRQTPPQIPKAMRAMRESIAKAESDPARPVYHFHPPSQWNNDPNGTIFYRGWHHLFYQVNPYGATWGHMHWGHARSRDLVNWEHLPVALWPSEEKGEEHVFSGGAILASDGRPRLLYTSIGKRDPEQWMAAPLDDDLIAWEKYEGNPVLTQKIHGGREVFEWRDPFLFQESGKTYMVCGGNQDSSRRGGGAAVQLYEATKVDLTEWKHRGAVFEYRESEVFNIECPNLFALDGKWVLLISPHRSTEYFVGSLDLERARFTPETHGTLDPGSTYASNISRAPDGRTLLWLWGKTGTSPAMGWNGCMAMPRVLSIDGAGMLRQQPVAEFNKLRGEERAVRGVQLAGDPVSIGDGDCIEIQAAFTVPPANAVGLRIGGRTDIVFDAKDGMLTVGNVRKRIGITEPLRLRVFLDRRVIEVFANDGQAAIFTTSETAGSAYRRIEAFTRGGLARIDELRLWTMRPATMSLDKFRV